MRLKIDAKVLRSLFHKNDQRILDAFKDLEINKESEPDERCPSFKSMQFSLITKKGFEDDYDLNLSIYDEDKGGYLGFDAKDLRLEGKATFDEEVYEFFTPVLIL